MALHSSLRWRNRQRFTEWKLSSTLIPTCALMNALGAIPASSATLLSHYEPPAAASNSLNSRVQHLYLDVVLNGVETQMIARFALDERGQLSTSVENLRQLGLKVDPTGIDGHSARSGGIYLSDLGLDYRYDAPNQRVYLTAQVKMLNTGVQKLRYQRAKAKVVEPHSYGSVLNYSFYDAISDEGYHQLTASTDLRLFSRLGSLRNTGLSRWYENQSALNEDYLRLETTYTFSLPDSLLEFQAGDLISDSLSWSRSHRLGGIQLRSNFALQPDLITRPLPVYFGEATLPSTIDLYIDGLRRYSTQVHPGAFELYTPASVNGLGQAEVVITDINGQEQVAHFDFYQTAERLDAGLTDFGVSLGTLREGFGRTDFDYDSDIALQASVRHGVNRRFTAETHFEASDDFWQLGAGGIVGLNRAGELEASWTHSQQGDLSGWQYTAGYRWQSRRVSLFVRTRKSHEDFRHLSSSDRFRAGDQTDAAGLSFSTGKRGHLSFSYARQKIGNLPDLALGSIDYRFNLQRNLVLSAGLSRNLDNNTTEAFSISLNWYPDRRLSASASSFRRDGDKLSRSYSVSRYYDDSNPLGWQINHVEGDALQRQAGSVQYRHDRAMLEAGWSKSEASEHGYLAASGSAIIMDRSVFLAREVYDSFALVTVDGLSDIPVMLENRLVGYTNHKGQFLLTGLHAYNKNKVSIDPTNAPANVRITTTAKNVTPYQNSGVRVSFDVQGSASALVGLKLEDGVDVPLGSRVRLSSSVDDAFFVGLDGYVFLENLSDENDIVVTLPDGKECRARIELTGADTIATRPEVGCL